MRRLSYKHALTALFFSGVWFVAGFLFMLSPIPNALGIGGELFQAWLVIFLIAMAIGGSMLTMAAFNGLFPPVVKPPQRRPAPVTTSTTRSTTTWQRTTTSSSPASRRDS